MNADESNEFFDGSFATRGVMVILRGHGPEATLGFAEVATRAGISMIEVPLQGEPGAAALGALVGAVAELPGAVIGAGTITDVELVDRAADLGARFTVAPGFDADVLARSLDRGMAHLPGVATATDVQHALNAGVRWLKGFPATSLGAAWFKAMLGPFPNARFVATGGITAANADDYFGAGVAAVSLGTSFASLGPADLAAVGVGRWQGAAGQ